MTDDCWSRFSISCCSGLDVDTRASLKRLEKTLSPRGRADLSRVIRGVGRAAARQVGLRHVASDVECDCDNADITVTFLHTGRTLTGQRAQCSVCGRTWGWTQPDGVDTSPDAA